MTNELIFRALFVGGCGTAAMDVWAIVLNRFFGLPLPNWGLVGRWFLWLPRGFMFHDDIAREKGWWFEEEAGWAAHYVTGIVYGAALLFWQGATWINHPTLLPALIVGWVTVGAGWFILQPGMGAGWAASKRDNPWKIRTLNLIAHSWFGLGMWVGAIMIA
jgi:hypothetical protein